MTRLAAAMMLTLMAACGADGPPVPPTKADATPALNISGEARIGVVKQF